jgi:biotin carboxylase
VEGGAADTRGRLLVLGAGPAQIGLLRRARERGLFVVAADRDPAAPGFAYADRRAIISAEDEQDVMRLAEAERIEGIVAPGIDWPVAVAARVAERLALPHPVSPETAALATIKARQRERLDAAGVSQPRWVLTRSPAHAPSYPCVVKPPDRQGQRGLSLVRRPDELAAAVERALAESRTGSCLIEELVEGPEVTVNGFSVDGRFQTLTVTDRLVAEPPAFGVALAHVWPAVAGADEAAAVAGAAVQALGIVEGPSYTQVRLSLQGPKVIEVAARLGGGHDAELCQAALGIDVNELAIDTALRGRVAEESLHGEARVGGACVRFLVAPVGRLEAVAGVDDALAVPGVIDVRVYRAPGHEFRPLQRGADRAGAVIAVGESRDDALATADEAAARIAFNVQRAGP